MKEGSLMKKQRVEPGGRPRCAPHENSGTSDMLGSFTGGRNHCSCCPVMAARAS